MQSNKHRHFSYFLYICKKQKNMKKKKRNSFFF